MSHHIRSKRAHRLVSPSEEFKTYDVFNNYVGTHHHSQVPEILKDARFRERRHAHDINFRVMGVGSLLSRICLCHGPGRE